MTALARRALPLCLAGAVSLQAAVPGDGAPGKGAPGNGALGIHLELSPRVCTLAPNDTQCDTRVQASWQSPRDESLCLVIADRPDVKRCWEHYSAGIYSIELVFTQDLVFQLKDLGMQRVLASEVLRVIREAIRYRHRRREPWNIFE
jgi:hypothetical protein